MEWTCWPTCSCLMENGKNSALDDYVYCLNSLWQSKMCGSYLSLFIVLCYLQPFTVKHREKYRQNILKSNLDGSVNGNERASSLDMYQTSYNLDIRHQTCRISSSLPKKSSSCYIVQVIYCHRHPGKMLPLAQQNFVPTDHHCSCILAAGCMATPHTMINIHSYFIRLDPSQKYIIYFLHQS